MTFARFGPSFFALWASTLQLASCTASPLEPHDVEPLRKLKGSNSGSYKVTANKATKRKSSKSSSSSSKSSKSSKTDYGDFECSDPEDSVDYRSSVLIDFTGRPPVTDDEVEALEREFVETYNYLASELCGRGVRGVTDAEVDFDIEPGLLEQGRRLQDAVGFTLLFRASGLLCDGCDEGEVPTLFSPGSGPPSSSSKSSKGSKSSSSSSKGSKGSRRLKGTKSGKSGKSNEDACTCKPSEEEFAEAYNDAVQTIMTPDGEDNIDEVVDVTELVLETCGETEDVEFFSAVDCIVPDDIDINVDLPDEEIAILEDIFVYSYNQVNQLNADICDPEFVVLEEAEFVAGAGGTRGRRELSFNYNCASGSTTGGRKGKGDEGSRRLTMSRSLARHSLLGRSLQDEELTELCLCPRGADDRGPTNEEFRDEMHANVEFLAAQGELQVCIGVLNVTLVEIDVSPDSPDDVSPDSVDVV